MKNSVPESVTLHGNKLTLTGNKVAVGDKAPDFKVLANDLSPVTLKDYEGRTLVILSVPSLDTPVCDTETVRFNREAVSIGSSTSVIAVSMDLPFAQARWCAAKAVSNVATLSDHRDASFGKAWGVLIEELRLLARAVFIVDGKGVIRYIQVVGETANEPDYDDVLQALKSI